MKELLVKVAILGAVIVVAQNYNPAPVIEPPARTSPASAEDVCERCYCASRPSSRPGVVHIDAGLAGGTVFGTGIVLTADGEVLTNDHVIRDTTGICVTTNDRGFHATVVGTEPGRDIALLRLRDATGLVTAPIGDSSTLGVGDAVTVLGNDEDPTPDYGEVEALGQTVRVTDTARGRSEHLTDLIEIDTEVLPGNSGGPLLNADEQVVGVSTAGSNRQGFAITINNALAYAERLRNGGST